jgi:hypothetical protein
MPIHCSLIDQWFSPGSVWNLEFDVDCYVGGLWLSGQEQREGSGRVIAVCRRFAGQASGHPVNPANNDYQD